jgi:hypothetical protein
MDKGIPEHNIAYARKKGLISPCSCSERIDFEHSFSKG